MNRRIVITISIITTIMMSTIPMGRLNNNEINMNRPLKESNEYWNQEGRFDCLVFGIAFSTRCVVDVERLDVDEVSSYVQLNVSSRAKKGGSHVDCWMVDEGELPFLFLLCECPDGERSRSNCRKAGFG